MIARTCIFFAFFWVLIDSLARCARFCNFEGFCTLESSITCWMAHIAWLFWASHKRICEHSRNLHVVCLLKDQIYLPMVPPALGLLPCRKCFHQRWRRSFPFHISSVLPVPRKKILSWRPRDTRRSLWVRPFAGKKIQTLKLKVSCLYFMNLPYPSLQHLAQWVIVSLKDRCRDLSFDVLAWFGVLARDHQIKSGSFSWNNVLDWWFSFLVYIRHSLIDFEYLIATQQHQGRHSDGILEILQQWVEATSGPLVNGTVCSQKYQNTAVLLQTTRQIPFQGGNTNNVKLVHYLRPGLLRVSQSLCGH